MEPPAGNKLREIPKAEQVYARAAGRNDVAPESLKDAFATFLLLCANDCVVNPEIENRQRFDMLVHSDMKNNVHLVFDTWLHTLRDNWRMALRDLNNPDTLAERDRYFAKALEDLNRTATPPIRPLSELFGPPLAEVLDRVMIWLINDSANSRDHVQLNAYLYNVLNGGEMLGVGFTIDRLHVSHVIRPEGQGQMDTIQQRGRFFGYRGSYFDNTRIWLENDVKRLFEGYVDQETWIRRDLKRYDDENLKLTDWKVRLRLLPDAVNTRRQAVKLVCQRFEADEQGWVRQRHWISDQRQKDENFALLTRFLNGTEEFGQFGELEFRQAESELCGRDPDGKNTHHRSKCDFGALRLLLGEFATEVRDAGEFDILRTTLDEIDSGQNPELADLRNLPVDVFYMAKEAREARRRKIEPKERVTLFQGGNRAYVGDRAVHGHGISIQLHVVNHGPSDEKIQESGVLYLTVRLPQKAKEWAEGWIKQVQ